MLSPVSASPVTSVPPTTSGLHCQPSPVSRQNLSPVPRRLPRPLFRPDPPPPIGQPLPESPASFAADLTSLSNLSPSCLVSPPAEQRRENKLRNSPRQHERCQGGPLCLQQVFHQAPVRGTIAGAAAVQGNETGLNGGTYFWKVKLFLKQNLSILEMSGRLSGRQVHVL